MGGGGETAERKEELGWKSPAGWKCWVLPRISKGSVWSAHHPWPHAGALVSGEAPHASVSVHGSLPHVPACTGRKMLGKPVVRHMLQERNR